MCTYTIYAVFELKIHAYQSFYNIVCDTLQIIRLHIKIHLTNVCNSNTF